MCKRQTFAVCNCLCASCLSVNIERCPTGDDLQCRNSRSRDLAWPPVYTAGLMMNSMDSSGHAGVRGAHQLQRFVRKLCINGAHKAVLGQMRTPRSRARALHVSFERAVTCRSYTASPSLVRCVVCACTDWHARGHCMLAWPWNRITPSTRGTHGWLPVRRDAAQWHVCITGYDS